MRKEVSTKNLLNHIKLTRKKTNQNKNKKTMEKPKER